MCATTKYVSVAWRSTGGEVERRLEIQRSAVERRDPIEDLNPRRHGDEHAGRRERRVGERPHPDGEHMVCPDGEAQKADRDAGVRDEGIAEDRLAGEDRQDLRDDTKCWQN